MSYDDIISSNKFPSIPYPVDNSILPQTKAKVKKAAQFLTAIHFLIVCDFFSDISSANLSSPISLMRQMQAFRSDRKIKPIILEKILLNFGQSLVFLKVSQLAQVRYFFSRQHVRTLHQVALEFSRHPEHLSFKYFLQAPQYNPQ